MGDNNTVARPDRVGRRRHDHDPRAPHVGPGGVKGTGKVGDEAAMTVRASTVEVRPGSAGRPAAANTALARLNFAEYLGDSVKLHLDVAGEPFTAKVAETRYAERCATIESGDVTVRLERRGRTPP